MSAPLAQPLILQNGSHLQQHGATVHHSPISTFPEQRATAANVSVFSLSDFRKSNCVVMLSVCREPFSSSINLEPNDALQLADSLRMAAQQALAVDAIKSARTARGAA